MPRKKSTWQSVHISTAPPTCAMVKSSQQTPVMVVRLISCCVNHTPQHVFTGWPTEMFPWAASNGLISEVWV